VTIRTILGHRALMSRRFALRLNLAKKVALAATAASALAAPVMVGIVDAPAIRAQSPQVVAQSHPGATPKFEVASVKRAPPPADGGISVSLSGGPGTHNPGQLTYTNVTLETVIKVAHGIMGPAFDPARQDDRISGPGWLTTERYNIVAKIPADTTKDDFKLMLQNLLAERFKLIMHRETKDASGYALVIAKNGLKMKESTDEANPQSGGPPPKFDVDQDGFRIFPPGRSGVTSNVANGITRLTASKVSMGEWASTLKALSGAPVTDETGLHGKFDFRLEFVRDPAVPGRGGRVMQTPVDGDAEPGPTLADAVQKQLGLRLEPKKVSSDTLVIDHLEKAPTEN